MKKAILIILLSIGYISLMAQDFNLFKKEVFISGSDTLRYRILYPENFDPGKKYPLLFFLHGSGERGDDNEKQLTHGAKLFLSPEFRNKHAAIVIFPQCPADRYWSNVEIDAVNGKRFFNFKEGGKPTKPMDLLLKFTDHMVRRPFTDPHRIYVGGLSMGGMGTFELLARKAKIFAGAISICGGDNPKNAKKYKDVPLWIFHGGLDDVVHPQFSYNVYKALKDLGHEPKFTIYPKANHNSWDSAFAEPGLMDWLFALVK